MTFLLSILVYTWVKPCLLRCPAQSVSLACWLASLCLAPPLLRSAAAACLALLKVVRRPADPVGPRQYAPRDRVDLSDRAAALAQGRSGYNERVNPTSDRRQHSLEG